VEVHRVSGIEITKNIPLNWHIVILLYTAITFYFTLLGTGSELSRSVSSRHTAPIVVLPSHAIKYGGTVYRQSLNERSTGNKFIKLPVRHASLVSIN
jgi:hypothetical protein